MAMQLAALDILITKGGFAPESARAIGEAVDLEIERSRNSLATGQQLTDTRLVLEKQLTVLEGKLTDTRLALEKQITDTRLELEKQITDTRLELQRKIESVRQELTDRCNKLEHKIEQVRLELLAKLEATKSEVLRWMFVAMTSQTVVLVGLMRLFK
jgi:hypothetical protein